MSNYANVSSVCFGVVVDYRGHTWFDVVMNHSDGPLTTGEVAAIFGVTMTTVKRWAEEGKLPYFRTPGGHYRFQPDDVARLRESSAAA